jgi:hypothetical protein
LVTFVVTNATFLSTYFWSEWLYIQLVGCKTCQSSFRYKKINFRSTSQINFKHSSFSASMFIILFFIEFLLEKTFSNAVRLLRESVIIILLQFVSLGCSIAFKIANISALKIVICGNNRYLSVEEGITTAQPTCSSFFLH